MKSIEYINLQGNKHYWDSRFADILHNTGATYINLANNTLGNQDIDSIITAIKHPKCKLTNMNLKGNNISSSNIKLVDNILSGRRKLVEIIADAISSNNVHVVQKLHVRKHVPLNHHVIDWNCKYKGHTLLTLAALKANKTTLSWLLKNGCNNFTTPCSLPDSIIYDGDTPFEIARSAERPEIAQMLQMYQDGEVKEEMEIKNSNKSKDKKTEIIQNDKNFHIDYKSIKFIKEIGQVRPPAGGNLSIA